MFCYYIICLLTFVVLLSVLDKFNSRCPCNRSDLVDPQSWISVAAAGALYGVLLLIVSHIVKASTLPTVSTSGQVFCPAPFESCNTVFDVPDFCPLY